MNRVFRNTIFYILILLLVIGVVSWLGSPNQKPENMSYSKFSQNLSAGKVESISIQPVRGVYEIRGQLDGAKKDEYFITHVP
ncbi:ATP-dependent metallopeptidase FtsH/Yme1/Tma family protein, partial [Planococcus sp. SIMBA_160]